MIVGILKNRSKSNVTLLHSLNIDAPGMVVVGIAVQLNLNNVTALKKSMSSEFKETGLRHTRAS